MFWRELCEALMWMVVKNLIDPVAGICQFEAYQDCSVAYVSSFSASGL